MQIELTDTPPREVLDLNQWLLSELKTNQTKKNNASLSESLLEANPLEKHLHDTSHKLQEKASLIQNNYAFGDFAAIEVNSRINWNLIFILALVAANALFFLTQFEVF